MSNQNTEKKHFSPAFTQLMTVLACIVLAIALGYLVPSLIGGGGYAAKDLPADEGQEVSLLQQEKLGVRNAPHVITKVYFRNSLVGVLSDKEQLSRILEDVYARDYEEKFPNTSIGLGEDVYVVDQVSYYDYENIDETLMDYLRNNDLFSVMTNKIIFSNGAVIYVRDLDVFMEARETYLLNFIDEGTYNILAANRTIPTLTEYGEQSISLEVLETMSVTDGLASEAKILTTREEILNFFSYGYDTIEKEYYTTVDGDTVAGVITKAGANLSAKQLITLNPEILVSEEQLLAPGTKLNITYFDSPINVVVVNERLTEITVYPESTRYIYDDTMEYGSQVVEVEQVVGKTNVRYHDTYTNGILTKGEEISSVVTVQPVQRVVRVGTRTTSDVVVAYTSGSGEFWWPVENPFVSCGWFCYAGHSAIDVQNRYDNWGLVFATDGGTVVMNSYSSYNGYFMIIDHGNGFYSYYGHMRVPGFFDPGYVVAQGEAIGHIGMTGMASGPHVHFAITYGGMPYFGDGVFQNPCGYLGC